MTVYLSPHVYGDIVSRKFYEELPREQQVAVRLRWGNRLDDWYWEEVHIPSHLIEGAQNMTQLKKICALLDMVFEGEEKNETTNGHA